MAQLKDLIVNGASRFIGPMYGNLTGNADTATALTSNAGSTTQPIYFSGGKPVAITGNIANGTTGNAATATTATNLAAAPSVAFTAGTSAGPTLTVTAGGKTSAAVAVPSASASNSGIITTGAQTIVGSKTFSNLMTLQADQYGDTANTGALNLSNSDIYGVNSIKFADLSDTAGEGLQWYRDSTHIDSMWVKSGIMYFTPNRTWGGTATNYVIPTITSTTTTANYPLISTTTAGNNVYNTSITMNGGTITATKFVGALQGNADSATALTSNAGSTTQPIYFSGGKPVAITGAIANSTTGNAATATALTSSAGSTTQPVYFSNGKPVAITGTIANSTTGNAATATKVNNSLTLQGNGTAAGAFNGSAAVTVNVKGSGATTVTGASGTITVSSTDTKNTAGSTNLANTKLFLIGATSQAANPQTYSNSSVYISTSNVLMGAAWNDYAEYRKAETIEAGRCICESENGIMKLTMERMMKGCEIISDTFGFAIGENEEAQTPIAVSGRVLAYPDGDRNKFEIGMPVCSGPNGTVSQMTEEEARMYPWCIIGTVSEIPDYEEWGAGKVKVNNRIWIRVR